MLTVRPAGNCYGASMPELCVTRARTRWRPTSYRVELDGIRLGVVANGETVTFPIGEGEHALQLIEDDSSVLDGLQRKSGSYRIEAGEGDTIRIDARPPSLLGQLVLFVTAATIGPIGDPIQLDRR